MGDVKRLRVEQSPAEREFGEAALRCIDDVARFAHSLARNGDDADDLVQETYLRALRSRHTFRHGADMRRWLFTICRNVFLRTLERAADTVALDGDPRDDTYAVVRLHGDLVASGEDRLVDHIDVGPAIIRALDALPPVFRAVIVLVDMEGYDYSEAADTLGVPVGTVRSRLFRARRLLQESLRTVARDAGIGKAVHHQHGSMPA
ncbi:MAG TPA: sigma-70 family RNA polymerase sigma factor [Gemmatimonas sp.]|nr:sigma-70 family RNA polymerase sigma factor [Gemmatimonas sp.]